MADDKVAMLMATLVPPGIMCSEQIGTLGGSLLDGETELLTPNAVSKRREEFTAGRTCARAALGLLGIAPSPILRGLHGEPLWPKHVIGSITHCGGYCAAAVTTEPRYRSLGIDAEPNEALPPGVLELIARPEERQWIANMTDEKVCFDRLLFSIKESVYKVWYPLEQCWLDFHQAHVEIDLEAEIFRTRLNFVGRFCPQILEGRYTATRSLILTCSRV
ncbi:4'-phosphopantetheinyl transferase [Granulicella sp. S190]|uniref:4'-phosphopantetheinyl transferase family protein n=1 Tax=Granulicella sp. S190 TaxID=1747226 RepID=UPI00131EC707|nr:4'-phosphopantetheinyl transferase superfamily protein [Granulicella sp. S190]